MRDYTPPREHTEVEKWIESLGTRFVEIWLYDPRTMTFVSERHVDDHETLLETINMALYRLKLNVAMWADGTGWTSIDKRTGETRSWPSRAAAEMGAIHDA